MSSERVNLSLQLDPVLNEKLESYAADHRKNKSIIVRQAIKEFMEKEEKCSENN